MIVSHCSLLQLNHCVCVCVPVLRLSCAAAVEFVEAALGKHPGKFITGSDAPTLADLLLVPEFDQLPPFGLFDYTPYPAVQAWLAAIKAGVPGYDEVYAAIPARLAAIAAAAAAK